MRFLALFAASLNPWRSYVRGQFGAWHFAGDTVAPRAWNKLTATFGLTLRSSLTISNRSDRRSVVWTTPAPPSNTTPPSLGRVLRQEAARLACPQISIYSATA